MKAGMAVVVLFAATTAAMAQPDLPTSEEMLASYCLGASNQMSDTPTGERAFDEIVRRGNDAVRQRLRSYLVARGYGISRAASAVQGLAIYTNRGIADHSACQARIAACVPVCKDIIEINDLQKCMDQCRDVEPACPQLARCSPDRLPF